MIKIGNTSFREDAISKMTLKQFKDTYKGALNGQDLEETYSKITGKKLAKEKSADVDGSDSSE
jgi:hypothetical protein